MGLNHVYFEKRIFFSSGLRWSLTQRRSAMTKGSRFRRASKVSTRRIRSSALAWQWVIGAVLPQPAPQGLHGHQVGAVTRKRHQPDKALAASRTVLAR